MGKGCCGQQVRPGVNGGGQNFVPAAGKRCVTDSHREDVCHGTNERRRDLLDQLKIYLDEFDERPCPSSPPKSSGPDALRPLAEYPEYMKKHCQSWMPDPSPPTITCNGTHEQRITSDYEKAKKEQSEYVSFVDANANKKPIPPSCECARRNGLQDQCSNPECIPPTPQCLATNPGPCCPPSLGMTGREAAEKARREQRRSLPESTYRWDFRYDRDGQNCCKPTSMRRPQPEGCGQYPGQGQMEVVGLGVYKTVYNKDYGPPQTPGSSLPTSAPGQQMVCFCNLPPSALPSGKKYLCCPLPE